MLRNTLRSSSVLLFVLFSLSALLAAEKKSLLGTWYAGEDGLVLTFAGKDSLFVKSLSDSSMGGSGTYTRTDSTFSASVNNGDMSMKMIYTYRWKGKDTVEAKPIYMDVNGDSVEYPHEWATMVRNNSKSCQTVPAAAKESPSLQEKRTKTKK
jgi:hypothetical protein